jgi:hypothetical protein
MLSFKPAHSERAFPPASRLPSRRRLVPTRIDLFPGETVPHAIRRLKKIIWRECIDDRNRRQLWGTSYYQKPGYVRRQEKFFAMVNGRTLRRWAEWRKQYGIKPR